MGAIIGSAFPQGKGEQAENPSRLPLQREAKDRCGQLFPGRSDAGLLILGRAQDERQHGFPISRE